jgi:type IV pilus assembly protein PilE
MERMRSTPTPTPGASARIRGFTLIELMITVAVVAILAAVAMPAYFDSVRKSRRGDAITALNQISQAQERWRANNVAYTTDLSASGLRVSNPASGYYTLAVSAAASASYTATATAAGAQSGDSKCTALTLSMNGGAVTYASSGSGTANFCWNRR